MAMCALGAEHHALKLVGWCNVNGDVDVVVKRAKPRNHVAEAESGMGYGVVDDGDLKFAHQPVLAEDVAAKVLQVIEEGG